MINSTEDLARHLGLSRWTVSRALNGHPGVKEETRKLVLKAAEKHGFQPSAVARGLRGGRTGLVGVCFQELESPILAKKTSELQRALRGIGVQGLIELSGGDPSVEVEVLRHFMGMKVDGVILAGSTLEPESDGVIRLKNRGVPTVAVDPVREIGLPTVELDREFAMIESVKVLAARGCNQFKVLGVENDDLYGNRKFRGIQRGIEEAGFNYMNDVTSIGISGFGLQDFRFGYEMAKIAIQDAQFPEGWIMLNDRTAIGAIRALQEMKIRVPQRIAIVGFDDLDAGAWFQPALTTINQQIPDMMGKTVALLKDLIEGKTYVKPPKRKTRPKLIERETT